MRAPSVKTEVNALLAEEAQVEALLDFGKNGVASFKLSFIQIPLRRIVKKRPVNLIARYAY